MASVKPVRRWASALVSNFGARFGTSNPLGGIRSVFGGFDSHALPPTFCLPLTEPRKVDKEDSRHEVGTLGVNTDSGMLH